jgi:hypothetical protein
MKKEQHIVPMVPLEYVPLIQVIVAMRNLIGRETNELVAANPNWDAKKDARVTVFWNMLTVLDSTLVGLTFTKGILPIDEFWSEHGLQIHSTSSESVETAKKYIESGLEGFIKVGFIQVLFSIVESALRSYLRALDPLA